MRGKKNCGCTPGIDKYVDVSCINPQSWNSAPVILGLTMCGDIVPLDKPEYELSKEDRTKLDMLDNSGKGRKFLGDDGKYQAVVAANIFPIILEYCEDPANFVITNQSKLTEIRDNTLKRRETFVRLHVGHYFVPVDILFNGKSLVIQYDQPLVTFVGEIPTYRRLKIFMSFNTKHPVFIKEHYSLQEFVDADAVIRVGGKGHKALYDDGQYLLTYNAEEIDAELSGIKSSIDEGLSTLRDHTDSEFASLKEHVDAGLADANESIRKEVERATAAESELADGMGRNASDISEIKEKAIAGFKYVNDTLGSLDGRVSANEADIAVNTSDIASLRDDFTNQEKFWGYFNSTAEITVLKATPGDYAWSAESGTVWAYNGNSWYDTTTPIPDQTVAASDSTPLMDGEPDPGLTNKYARGDHRHPTDTTRASAGKLNDTIRILTTLREDHETYASENDAAVMDLRSGVEKNADNIAALGKRVSRNAQELHSLANDYEDYVTANDQEMAYLKTAVAKNADGVVTNAADIRAVESLLQQKVHFRGYFSTTKEVTEIENPYIGDYAFNAQSGTKWVYNGETWQDTGDIIPDQTVEPYEGDPLMDGVASPGLMNQYARGDHRHPTDTTRAASADLENATAKLDTLTSTFEDYASSNDADISAIREKIAEGESSLSSVADRVSLTEGDIVDLWSRATATDEAVGGIAAEVSNIEGQVSQNTSDIASLRSDTINTEHFRGYYLSTAEVTNLAGTPGDYAWSAESGTVWVYNSALLTWQSSGRPIPSEVITPADTLPLMDGEADPGESTEYARADHKHPTDVTRQKALESGINIKTVGGSSILGAGDIPFPETAEPTGKAGGDLSGTYPNPVIASKAVTEDKMGDNIPVSLFTNDSGYITADSLKVKELSPVDGVIDLGEAPKRIVMVFCERVPLYEGEYALSGSELSITTPDISLENTDKVKVLYY